MTSKRQPGFFDIAERTAKLTQMGDPLVGLKEQIGWEAFRPDLNRLHEKERKSSAGACENKGATTQGDYPPYRLLQKSPERVKRYLEQAPVKYAA